eukprot:1161908-Pelagomonas_calceolata.AAC.4
MKECALARAHGGPSRNCSKTMKRMGVLYMLEHAPCHLLLVDLLRSPSIAKLAFSKRMAWEHMRLGAEVRGH